MTQLKKLSLDGQRIADPSFLSGLTALETLRLDRCGLADLGPLSSMGALRYLSVNDNEISDLAPLIGAIELTELKAARNRISDIGGLANCTRLETVDLSGNRISDASILQKSAPYLLSLDLSGNRITELSFLAEAKALQSLRADGNKISRAELGALAELQTLSLRSCSLESLILPDTRTLQSIDLFDNALGELALPAFAPKLKYLDVSFNRLPALIVPDSQEKLTLIVSANPLFSLSFVDPYQPLAWLILDNCPDELLCSEAEGNLSDALHGLNVSEMAFRYPSAGLKTERLARWKATRYYVSETPLDRIADLRDGLGEFRVNLVDSLWELTENVRTVPVGLAAPPASADYAAAPEPPDGAAA